MSAIIAELIRKIVKGTGLGTAIARDIIEAHGATVELASQVDKGTIVKIGYQAIQL